MPGTFALDFSLRGKCWSAVSIVSSLPDRAPNAHPVRLLQDADGFRHVAVLRALQLGDMLCAVPALRALRLALPDARITLIGLPWADAFARRFAAYIDAFIEFPGYPGLPERAVDAKQLLAFFQAARQQRFDLAIQLHGSGSFVNDCIELLGARRSAGFHEPNAIVPDADGFMPWPTSGTETARLLGLVQFLGAGSDDHALEFPIVPSDRAELRAGLAALTESRPLDAGTYVCVHPGARFRSRRWPIERFAAVADALASHGLTICVTGTAQEADVTAAVAAAMYTEPIDLTGRLTLGALAALVSDAALVVTNDTGMSHIAAAVRTPSVVVASGSDVRRWAPHDAERHRVLWQDVPCRPCMHEVCPIGHVCATAVSASDVIAEASALLARESPARSEPYAVTCDQ